MYLCKPKTNENMNQTNLKYSTETPPKYPQSFTGKERDSETGFSYFGARYYDSDILTGWLSVDPMADKYPNISPYAYCGWNPVKLVDPNGEDFKVVINERKKTMTITANIILYTKSSIMGKNELENSAKYYRQSINAWFKDKNGESWTYNHKGKTYSIDFNINIIVDPQAKNKSRRHYNGINNYIDINPDDGFRSIVYNSKFGTWAKAISKQNSARHEFGHLLYLSDRYYDDENSEKGYVPHKGWEGNVMGERYGEVQQRNITEALDKYFKRNEEK
jgi:RHS repeat-associated protein